MAGLFLASFSVTWALQPPAAAPESVAMNPPATIAAALSVQEPVAAAEAPTAQMQWQPTLYELAVDQDADTSAEARALLVLLDEEGSVD
jgi:hypothetical protein